jgi:hypothetical protein
MGTVYGFKRGARGAGTQRGDIIKREFTEGKKFLTDDFIGLPAKHLLGRCVGTYHASLLIESYDPFTRCDYNTGQFLLGNTFDEIQLRLQNPPLFEILKQ